MTEQPKEPSQAHYAFVVCLDGCPGDTIFVSAPSWEAAESRIEVKRLPSIVSAQEKP